MKKTLPLKNVSISFDPETANIELISKDRSIPKNRSVKLTISAQTESYRTLLQLLIDSGQADLDALNISRDLLRIDDAKSLRIPGEDPRTKLLIGRGLNDRPVALDLSRHVILAGDTGSGKSVAMRNVLCHGLEQDQVEIWGIDLKRLELGGYAYREQDLVVYNQEDALQMLQALAAKLKKRHQFLKEIGSHSYLDADFRSIYLIIDEITLLTEPTGDQRQEGRIWDARAGLISELLVEIARLGRAGGVHLIVGAMSPERVPPLVRISLFERIYMGSPDPGKAKILFGRPGVYGGAYLEPRGRGVLASLSEQTLFQSYFIPYDTYRAPRDA